jgi:acetyl esterase/lipase
MKIHSLAWLALLPIAWLAPVSSAAAEIRPPDFANVKYGPYERNVLDLWQAQGAGSRPLLVYIHGGGWNAGDKADVKIAPYRKDLLRVMLESGVSVASVNYRYSRMAILPAPVHDAARAIQFLRSRAQAWNLNKARVAAAGASAGGCTSLWLAYHPDLANPSQHPTRSSGNRPDCAPRPWSIPKARSIRWTSSAGWATR